MVAEPFIVDLNKPIVFQVGHLGQDYDKWVHHPIVSKEGPRFFGNDFMEELSVRTYKIIYFMSTLSLLIIGDQVGAVFFYASFFPISICSLLPLDSYIPNKILPPECQILELLTRTKWWVIPIVWLPVISWLVSVSIGRGLTPSLAAASLGGGVLFWTFLEYFLHRFLFHMKTTTYWANTLHYLLHGCHHKHPLDALRLVFPPAATAILAVPVWTFIRLLSPPDVAPSFFGGGLLGYVMYDLTHYYLHHGKPHKGYFENIKRYHLNHHFKVQTMGFGITSKMWDVIFGTLPPTKAYGKDR
ncbi:hypothetical protein ACFE04_013880 [Oxalis oulophora]